MPAAWDLTTGSHTVYVGVIDSGIYAAHQDLVNRVNTRLSRCFTNDFDTALEDATGHGTHVAGVIGAQRNNSVGIVGTCWDVQLVSLRVAKQDGHNDLEKVISAIKYAESVGIPIINCSIGFTCTAEEVETDYAEYIQELRTAIADYSGLFVTAAGNDNNNNDVKPYYPSAFNDLPNVISVGASNKRDQRYYEHDGEGGGSNYGATTVDIFAPGVDILTTRETVTGTRSFDGTSVAAPFVSGVAALLLSLHPNLTAANLKTFILQSAEPTMNGTTNVLANLCTSGGRLNAYNTLTALGAHSFTTVNDGVSAGHTRTCACGYSYSEGHEWVMYPTFTQCRVCNARSMNVVRPQILPPKQELLE